MQNENTRNTIIFLVCMLVVFVFYQMFVLEPAQRQRNQERAAAAARAQAQNPPATPTAVTAAGAPGSLGATQTAAPSRVVTRAEAIAASGQRIEIRTPTLNGSIALRGARFDDLSLMQYRQTVDRNSAPVELLRPSGAEFGFFAEFGWYGPNIAGLPGPDTVWSAPAGAVLTPQSPVTLTYNSPNGLSFTRTISVDANYMFTVTDAVANRTGAAIAELLPAARVRREGVPARLGHNQIVHEGGIAILGNQRRELKYGDWRRLNEPRVEAASDGWLGITDQYWMAAIVPAHGRPFTGRFERINNLFDASFIGQSQALPNGQQRTSTLRFFAGAKQAPLLVRYQNGAIPAPGIGDARISRFDEGVDWGNFWFFTRPVFLLLDWLFQHIGNFGLAILALTVVVKAIFFPLANKSFESLTKMKKVQPELEALKTKYKDDAAGQQREMMAIYQREKINPFMGCLPILVQIPVFYALYKVLTVTIEMRHAPFFGVITDLSARDPTTMWNLFGILPFSPAAVPGIGGLLDANLHVGVFAILYGLSMWLSQSMAPQTGMDPMQRRILAFMPLIFTFALAQLAVGLMIYYTWSNILSIAQQYVIMRRYKVDNPIDDIIARFSGARPKAAE